MSKVFALVVNSNTRFFFLFSFPPSVVSFFLLLVSCHVSLYVTHCDHCIWMEESAGVSGTSGVSSGGLTMTGSAGLGSINGGGAFPPW